MRERKRIHIFYLGTVQGVGFRFTVERIAGRIGVDGFVRNLPDGRVEMVAEGSRDDIDHLVQEVGRAMSGYISGTEVDWEQYTGEYAGFGIRF